MSQEPESSFHVFIVPDGTRRWADQHQKSRFEGYAAGRDAFREQTHTIWDHGVTHVTVWALSLDNLAERSSEDICRILNILAEVTREFFQEIPVMKRRIRFRAVGNWRFGLPSHVSRPIEELEIATKHHTQGVLTFLIAYDGQTELCEMYRRSQANSLQSGANFASLRKFAPTYFLPNVDIYLRTGGEPHLSANALPFQMRDPELFFPEKYWPDFTADDMAKVVAEYKKRRRRHGA